MDMLTFDYHLKQIINMVAQVPEQIEALSMRLSEFEERFHNFVASVQAMHSVELREGLAIRLTNLDRKMAYFLSNLHVPGQRLANMRESYSLAIEMQELRALMQA